MITSHSILNQDARKVELPDESVHLVITSPPYPMISMWDEQFFQMNPQISKSFEENPYASFEKMHQILDNVWNQLYRLVTPGGIVAINVGDAVRTINEKFQLFPNHSRIIQIMLKNGFVSLPPIIWRKQTNAPNKFMGSGMLPAGAYVTYEHEYILIFRKGGKRKFSPDAKLIRQESAYFWSERNQWFSDLWEFKGTRQYLNARVRKRNGSFPFELPYRLINMYSIYGDTVFDPFCGLGTTIIASMISGRNSIGVEIEKELTSRLFDDDEIKKLSNETINHRIQQQVDFIHTHQSAGKKFKHWNTFYNFPVITGQEKKLRFYQVDSLESNQDQYYINYKPFTSINNKYDSDYIKKLAHIQ